MSKFIEIIISSEKKLIHGYNFILEIQESN